MVGNAHPTTRSPISQPLQIRLAHPEVMPDLVQHGDAHLPHQIVAAARHLLDVLLKNVDDIRHYPPRGFPTENAEEDAEKILNLNSFVSFGKKNFSVSSVGFCGQYPLPMRTSHFFTQIVLCLMFWLPHVCAADAPATQPLTDEQ